MCFIEYSTVVVLLLYTYFITHTPAHSHAIISVELANKLLPPTTTDAFTERIRFDTA